MIDVGRGIPIVLVPGIQGRCEWMAPTIRALGARHRVLSFSLDEAAAPGTATETFDRWVDEIDELLDRAREPRAAVVGVSFGGLVAARYAAERPARTPALVMASSPSPRARLDRQSVAYLRHPRLALPLFAARACARLLPETLAARVTWTSRARFLAGHLGRVLHAPIHPRLMASWVRAWMAVDLEADCRRIAAPTLVITGEPDLDRVVPVAQSLEACECIAGATHVVLRQTGHIGSVSRPVEFAELVSRFVDAAWRRGQLEIGPAIGRAG